MITLRQLRYFCAVARLRHFGRAAEECSVSQPALSVQIQELEQALGVTLVERGRGRAELTAAGVEIEKRARGILTDTRDLMDFARHRGAFLGGPFRLGVIPSIAPYLLPGALPALHARFPDLDLQLRETMTAALLDELVAGRLDLVLLSLPLEQPALESIRLFDDAFVLAAPAGGAEEAAAPLEPLSRLEMRNLLLLEEGHCLREQALTYCKVISPDLRSQFGASSLATLIQMVANGYGSTLLPEIAVPSELRGDRRIVVKRFPAPEPMRTIGLAWRKSSPRKTDFIALGRVITESSSALLEEARRVLDASAVDRLRPKARS
ncbi:MAG: LysR family transcriptional regulator [Rhizobiales bacterium 65-9]|nr:LysR family transcriptional regulator [Hyphomicrobiales bacterium]OJY36762.1 MAG: LysR family transcriptional regulator [Rhizobiales bacterium 65-9]